jgi:hypothetical protein
MRTPAAVLCPLVVVAAAAAMPASAQTTPPASIAVVGTPALYVDTGADRSIDRPVAWVLFRTNRKLHEPRLTIASVAGTSGRSYAAREAARCIRSTVVGTGKNRFRAGTGYTVRIAVRATAHSRDRRVIFTRSLKARGHTYPAGKRRPPRC